MDSAVWGGMARRGGEKWERRPRDGPGMHVLVLGVTGGKNKKAESEGKRESIRGMERK